MSHCDKLKNFLIESLLHDAELHDAGSYSEIGKLMQAMPSFEDCFAEDEQEYERLLFAETFWDMWVDARNHDWGYYPGIEKNDWPVLAREVCRCIRDEVDANELRKQAKVFDLAHPAPLWLQLWNKLLNRQR